MATGGDLFLEVEDLRYSYGQRHAVRGASFACRRGELFGFLGPNGAGKTTMVHCLAGLLRNYQGAMRLDGVEFAPGRVAEQRSRIGVVPQEVALYEDLTGRENLELFGRLYGLEGEDLAEAVRRALDLSGLTERAGDRVSAYSGGMKRRLNLAVGDLHMPVLLLLDEPTVGVDPQSRNHIFESLRALREEGRTLFYTTHYMEEAQRLCDRVGILNEGVVVDIGTPAELGQRAGIPGADLEQVFLHLTGRKLRDEP